jgi:hypothetical protein
MRQPSVSSWLSLITGNIALCDSVADASVFADILVDLVNRGLVGVANPGCVAFPASGEDGIVEILLLVLRLTVVSPSCASFFAPRFREVTLPPGVTFRRDRVLTAVCGSSSISSFSSGSDLRELRRVLLRCGELIVEAVLFVRDLAILHGEPSPTSTVGVALVMSLKGDFSRRRDGDTKSIALLVESVVDGWN